MQRHGFGRAAAVTQSNTVNVAPGFTVKAIYLGGAAAHDLKVLTARDKTAVFTLVPPGTILPISVKRVYDTGTDFADADMILLGD